MLNGKKIAILVANGFEQSEMTDPKQALDAAGVKTFIVSPEKNKVKGWKHDKWADEFSIDVSLDDANPSEYDGLLLPGGVMNPDKLRMLDKAIQFVKYFVENKKPIGAICHGPWTLVETNGLKGMTVTSWASIKSDLINAGATWVDKEVVRDKNLVTSRKPADIPAFNQEIIKLFS